MSCSKVLKPDAVLDHVILVFGFDVMDSISSLPDRTAEWVNPVSKSLLVVSCSEGRILPYGVLEDVLSRDENPKNCHTKDDRGAWFAIDLGLWVYPTAYTLRHSRGYGSRSSLRNWVLQVSKDGHDWLTVRTHENDTSLGEPG